MRPPDDGHLWYSIDDPGANTTWLFDINFFASSFSCIYGQGCPSIDTKPDPTETLGCCTHGAHMVDAEDRKNVERFSEELTAEDWQFRDQALAKGGALKKKKNGDWVTRKVDGACIFLNRVDFDGGRGCALHKAAERLGQRPMDWKPDVCWQVPIHLDIHEDEYGHETVLVRAWQRRDWGPGGDDFHWWCIEDGVAYAGAEPVYITLADELAEMVGETVYNRLKAVLDDRIESLGAKPWPTATTSTPVTLT